MRDAPKGARAPTSEPHAVGSRFRPHEFWCISEREDEDRSFRSGDLVRRWADAYPMLFDTHDCRSAANQCQLGYHYREWLAAITLYEATGLRSLLSKYTFRGRHARKLECFAERVPTSVIDLLGGRRQGPDLFVYNPARRHEWYFVEVKGLTERLTPSQQIVFPTLETLIQQPIRFVRVRDATALRNRGSQR